jgi:hypothetical protein
MNAKSGEIKTRNPGSERRRIIIYEKKDLAKIFLYQDGPNTIHEMIRLARQQTLSMLSLYHGCR